MISHTAMFEAIVGEHLYGYAQKFDSDRCDTTFGNWQTTLNFITTKGRKCECYIDESLKLAAPFTVKDIDEAGKLITNKIALKRNLFPNFKIFFESNHYLLGDKLICYCECHGKQKYKPTEHGHGWNEIKKIVGNPFALCYIDLPPSTRGHQLKIN